MVWWVTTGLLAVMLSAVTVAKGGQYMVDDSPGLGRTFDGIGAISGGGATSKLLKNYNHTIRSQILDYLFKPNFGASLHILKVEIGGDSQSTDGVEASHMHSETDLNFYRGYEWWLMKEAKMRNPAIKLYGLPWVFPGWLGGNTFNPYSNRSALVSYIVNWVDGALTEHGLHIDYVGIWNERSYDTKYIKMLRAGLTAAGHGSVQVVVADSGWTIVKDLLNDSELLKAVGAIGTHYPGSHSPQDALRTQRPLWASEEYSAYNDLSGGGCWARILCESYVNGHLSAVIAWNLLTSYYDNLPYPRSSLMVANEPWSGNYEVNSPIWTTAHYTQFMAPGWKYFLHGTGVGKLSQNGSYISLTSSDNQELTMVIETLDPSTSHCFYSMPVYTVGNQTATFTLNGSFAKTKKLRAWYSYLDFSGKKTILFKEMPPIEVKDGRFTLELPVNSVYTLTTLPPDVGKKGSYPAPPPRRPFPSTYSEDFEGYLLNEEAYNLAQQAGSFEVLNSGDLDHGQVLAQAVLRPPIDTCLPRRMTRPAVVFGNYKWSDVTVQYDFILGDYQGCTSGAYLAARVDQGGCDIMYSNGIYLWASAANQTLTLTGNHTRSLIYEEVKAKITNDKWHTLKLQVKGSTVTASLDKSVLIKVNIRQMPTSNGFVAFGTEDFGFAMFDNLEVLFSKEAKKPSIHKRQYRKKRKGLYTMNEINP